MSAAKVITGRAPQNHVIASVIRLLAKLTGEKWGYIPTAHGKGVRAIVYCGSPQTNMRMFIHVEGTRRRTRPKMADGDIEIVITRPETHQSLAHWESSTAATVAVALAGVVPAVAAAIRGAGEPKYLAAAAEAAALWEYFNRNNSEVPLETCVYYDDCLKYSLY